MKTKLFKKLIRSDGSEMIINKVGEWIDLNTGEIEGQVYVQQGAKTRDDLVGYCFTCQQNIYANEKHGICQPTESLQGKQECECHCHGCKKPQWCKLSCIHCSPSQEWEEELNELRDKVESGVKGWYHVELFISQLLANQKKEVEKIALRLVDESMDRGDGYVIEADRFFELLDQQAGAKK